MIPIPQSVSSVPSLKLPGVHYKSCPVKALLCTKSAAQGYPTWAALDLWRDVDNLALGVNADRHPWPLALRRRALGPRNHEHGYGHAYGHVRDGYEGHEHGHGHN
jgi:hypothetical protein